MLTVAQLQALKTEINADPALSSKPLTPDGAFDIAVELNKTAVPDFIVWRGVMSVLDIEQNGFAWNQLDSVPAAKYRIWERLTASGMINPSKLNVRQGINDFCKDATNATIVALRDSILPYLKRLATRAEKVLATGAGTTATPATMGFEGQLSYIDVQNARAS